MESIEPDSRTIEEWVARAAGGEEAAFAELMRAFAPRLQGLLYRMVLDWDLARDLAQETFIAAYRALPKYREAGKFKSWLFRIGSRRALDELRLRARRGEVELIDEGSAISSPESSEPGRSSENREIGAAIERAVAELPPEQRTAFVLYEYEDLSYAEIAEALGGSAKRVEMQLYRARKQLQERLGFLFSANSGEASGATGASGSSK